MEIIRLFHVVLIAYWGIATYSDVLILRLDFLFVTTTFDRLWSYWRLGSSFLGILGWSHILTYISSYSDISPWILSCLLSYQSPIITFFYLTHPTVTHDLTPLSIRRGCRSVLDHLGCVFINISDFRFNIFHDGRAWQIVDLLVTMFSLWQLACWVLICLHFACWVLICLHFAFWALIIIVVIHQLVLFC